MLYPPFYRSRGVRLSSGFTNPPVSNVDVIGLPFGSVYHHTDMDQSVPFGEDDPLLTHYKGKATVELIYGLGTPVGKLRFPVFNQASHAREFYGQYKQYERFENAKRKLARDQKILHVVTYRYIENGSIYLDQPVVDWLKFKNKWARICKTVGEKVADDARMHYIVLQPPVTVAPRSLLARATKSEIMTKAIFDEFEDENQLIALELFKWFDDEDRKISVFGNIPDEYLDRVHLLWIVGNKWTVYNLKLVNDWIKREGKGGIWAPDQMRTKFLGLLINFVELRSASLPEGTDEAISADEVTEGDGQHDSLLLTDPLESDDGGDQNLYANKPVETAVKKSKGGSLYLKPSQPASPSRYLNEDKANDDELFSKDNEDVEAAAEDKALDANVDKLEELHKQNIETKANFGEYTEYVPVQIVNPEDGVVLAAQEAAKKGLISAANVRGMESLGKSYTKMKSPHSDQTMAEYIKIPSEELQIPKEVAVTSKKFKDVTDTSMYNSTHMRMDKQYIETVLNKDIAGMVMTLQNTGIAVKSYNVTRTESLHDEYEVHTIEVVPVIGKKSTLRFRVPVVAPDGTYLSNGTRCRMRKQRGDIPIRKVSKDQVALTSYYSKMFVERIGLVVHNYEKWLIGKVNSLSVDASSPIKDVRYADVFQKELKRPRHYTILANNYASFTCGDNTFLWDASKSAENFGDIKGFDPDVEVPCGKSKTGILLIDYHGNITELNTDGRIPLGSIEAVLGIPDGPRPAEVASVGVFGKSIPVGMVLGRYMGLGTLLKTIKAKYRTVRKGSSYNLQSNEFAVRFSDEVLIVEKTSASVVMLINGFNRFHAQIKQYTIHQFDKSDVYDAVWATSDISSRHTRELDLLRKMWVDPITKDILVEMGEPTDVPLLLLSAVKLLELDQHPDPMDLDYMRDKGYERFSGIIYDEMIQAVRAFNTRPNNPNASMSINPEAVWYSIIGDQSTMPVDDSNPIQAMKDQECVIYSGHGGRSAQTMVASTRKFHESNLGVTGEGTVDSGDVGTIVFCSANPNYTSVRGKSSRVDLDKDALVPSQIVSPTFLLSPGIEYDDPKRINFAQVQNSRSTHAVGYKALPFRTGYEKIVPYRMGSMYAMAAKDSGVIDEVTDRTMKVTYKDGTTETLEIGRKYGSWSGKTIPHELTTSLKVGDKFSKDDFLAYNSRYFQTDPLSPKDLMLTMYTLGRVVLWETSVELEDGSGISKEFAKQLASVTTHLTYINVDFDTEVLNLLPVGTAVDSDSILCTLHPPLTGGAVFSDSSLSTLQRANSLNRRAKYHGVIERYEVLYTGEPDEMSASLLVLAEECDTKLIRHRKRMKKAATDGRVPVGFRVDGKPLGPNSMVVKVYITGETGMGAGDKLVVNTQMKSVVGKVYEKPPVPEDGIPIDVTFGMKSVEARVVESAILQTTTGALMVRLDQLFVEAYRNGGKE